jgi:8-oxo-dGTP diphosphatase
VALAPRRLPPQNGGMKTIPSPRLAVRALILHDARLLLVNAYGGGISDLWCAPGGGVERHQSLDANLAREVFEETGLTVSVGALALALISEFHDPEHDFHQVEMFYRCEITRGALRHDWRDPDAVVSERCFFSAAELAGQRFKPDLLAEVAFSPDGPVRYDPLELIVP